MYLDKIFISNQIRVEILRTCGQPTNKAYNLPGNFCLDILSYNNDERLCRILEVKLQEIASYYKTGKIIQVGDISKENTVKECVKMVFA